MLTTIQAIQMGENAKGGIFFTYLDLRSVCFFPIFFSQRTRDRSQYTVVE